MVCQIGKLLQMVNTVRWDVSYSRMPIVSSTFTSIGLSTGGANGSIRLPLSNELVTRSYLFMTNYREQLKANSTNGLLQLTNRSKVPRWIHNSKYIVKRVNL